MQNNKLREIWKSGGNTVNGWLGLPCNMSAEVVARAGFDSVTIDMQHGCVPFENVVPMFQAMAACDATPMARVPAPPNQRLV